MQSKDQYGVCGAAEWHRQESLQSEGSQELLFFEGLGGSSSGDVFEHVQLQFLLGGADVASSGWFAG
jgi:hypothetical protein